MYSVQSTVPVFVLSVSTGPSITCGTASLPVHCQSSAPAGGENILHTEGWGEEVARQKKKNVLHKFHTISTKPLVKEMTDQIIMTKKS